MMIVSIISIVYQCVLCSAVWVCYVVWSGNTECKTEEEKRDLRKKAKEYLGRAEQLKKQVKEQDGIIRI